MIASSVCALVQQNAYVSSAHGFTINPPSGWSTDESGSFGTVVIFYGPTESNFRVNMNVVAEATSLSLADYVSASKSQLSSGLTNYSIVSEGPITIGGLGAYQLVGTFTQGTFSIKNMQVVFVENREAYIVTSTALQSNYDTYSPVFTESVQTFKLTGLEFPWTLVIVGVVIAAGIVIGLRVILRRRKRRFAQQQRLLNSPP
jgi:DcrB-like protein